MKWWPEKDPLTVILFDVNGRVVADQGVNLAPEKVCSIFRLKGADAFVGRCKETGVDCVFVHMRDPSDVHELFRSVAPSMKDALTYTYPIPAKETVRVFYEERREERRP